MELILNTNKFGYESFLDTKIDSLIIGLKDFCINQQYSVSLKKLPFVIDVIKSKNKKIYLSINIFAKEKEIIKFKNIISKLIKLDIDGFVVSDLGILNIFKELGLENKVILDLQTYVTNKFSAKSLLNLNVNRISLSKEITLEDIIEIAKFNKSGLELLVQGYYPITYSKRPILSCYFKNFKLKKKSDLYFIKEESRDDYYYLLEEKNNLSVYYNKQYSLFNYLPELINNNISYLRIDSIFLSEEETKEYIEYYSKAINLIINNDFNGLGKLKEEFNNKFTYETPFLHNQSFLLKERER